MTLSLMLLVNYNISSKLEKLNEVPTTKSYRMLTEGHKFTPKPNLNTQTIRQRITKKTIHVAATNKTEAMIFKGTWQCGAAAISKVITRRLIERDCPSLMGEFVFNRLGGLEWTT